MSTQFSGPRARAALSFVAWPQPLWYISAQFHVLRVRQRPRLHPRFRRLHLRLDDARPRAAAAPPDPGEADDLRVRRRSDRIRLDPVQRALLHHRPDFPHLRRGNRDPVPLGDHLQEAEHGPAGAGGNPDFHRGPGRGLRLRLGQGRPRMAEEPRGSEDRTSEAGLLRKSMSLTFKQVYEKIKEKFPEGVSSIVECPGDAYCVVKAEALLSIAGHMKA